MPDARLLENRAPAQYHADAPPRDDEHEFHPDAYSPALAAADTKAGFGDYASALSWLDVAEVLDGELPPVYAAKRQAWASVVAAERGWPATRG